jgi:NDP-sugar pyrophosphorylase family protein
VIKELLLTHKVELLPVVEQDMTVADFITWDKVCSERQEPEAEILQNCPLVVMAGGKGTRLEPFTKILPKPLIPIGEKPIIQVIVDKFKGRGAKNFYFIVNYKGEMIESYFKHLSDQYEINYLWEKDFYGTAGGLKMMDQYVSDDLFVSNCDVIIKAKYENILEFHREQNAALTIVSAIQHYRIPYGVVDFKSGGDVVNIKEKPEYTFTVNTGLYVLNKRAIELIPDNVHMDMTDLISLLIDKGDRVVTYPVNENEYIDIGQWEEYKKSVSKLKVIDE